MKRDSRRTSPPQAPAEMVYWQYGPAPCALDLVRNHFAARVVRLAVHVLLRAYLRVFHDLRIRGGWGLGHLRGHLIVANHASHLDALVLISAFPLRRVNRVRSLCAKDYFFRSPLKRTLAFFLANTIPMDRTRFDARAAEYCREQLARGANVIVFPEGMRSPDGRVGEFLGGVGLMALKYHLPVLPACIRGAYECCRKGALLPRPGRIEVIFGTPVRYGHLTSRKRNWLAVAADLKARVRRLGRLP